MGDFVSENPERGGKWVQGGGIELPCKYRTSCVLLKKYKHIVRDAIWQKQRLYDRTSKLSHI